MGILLNMEGVLERICGHKVKVHGSGRTDAGVHARGQVAHADLITRLSTKSLYYALNSHLPDDIRVLKVSVAGSDFHARRSAESKEYRYFISSEPFVLPDKRLYCHNVYKPLDMKAMRAAAVCFSGEHDFASFMANAHRDLESSVRTIISFTVSKRGSEIMFRVRGTGFLYKQVRSMVGFLIRVGLGAEEPEAVKELLSEHPPRTARVPTAPARGLFLWQVWYHK
ncbi:MAG: tRNA pseudouridine(38-40) synthase TruA [Kiritimatiellia bacterium]